MSINYADTVIMRVMQMQFVSMKKTLNIYVLVGKSWTYILNMYACPLKDLILSGEKNISHPL